MSEVIDTIKTGLAEVEAKVNAKFANIENELADLAQKNGPGLHSERKGASVADLFIKSDQFKAMLGGAASTGRVEVKTTVTSSNHDVQEQRAPGLFNNAQRRLSLLQALPRLAVTSGVFEHMQLNGYTNAAAVQVAEGDAKAEAAIPTQIVQANISTIAHWVRASNQVLSDAPALSMQIDNLLRYGVEAKLEGELINGAGGAGKIHGLLPQAVAFVPTLTNKADQLGEAKASMEAAGWQPSLIVMNPADWFVVASERADTGNGQYVLGSPRDPAGANLWGVPVLTSPAIASGSSLILDQSQVAILNREGVTVMASREDGTNFTTNQTTILAEARYGLAVFAAGAVRKIVDVV